jgi:nucleotide-binding universal stress UspA family protein
VLTLAVVEAEGTDNKEDTMQPILFATDGSPSADEARHEAIELARLTGSPLAVVSVLHVPAPAYGAGYGYSSGELFIELAKTEQERVEGVLAEAKRVALDAGLTVETIVGEGNPVEEICRVATELDPRLLVVGAHGWGLVQRIVHGSVSTGLLHHAPCPVLIVPASQAAVETAERKAA